MELFLPDRILRVLQHARARHRGLRHRNGDVRVARDDPPMMVRPCTLAAAVAVGGGGSVGVEFDSVAGGDAAAEALGEDVHIGQVARLDDFQIEVAVKIGNAIVVASIRHGRE